MSSGIVKKAVFRRQINRLSVLGSRFFKEQPETQKNAGKQQKSLRTKHLGRFQPVKK
jgi:hypothetical protein